MDDHLVHTIPNHHHTRTKMDVLRKLQFKSTLQLNGQCGIQIRPPTNSDDLYLLFCLYPASMLQTKGENFARKPMSFQKCFDSRHFFISYERKWSVSACVYVCVWAASDWSITITIYATFSTYQGAELAQLAIAPIIALTHTHQHTSIQRTTLQNFGIIFFSKYFNQFKYSCGRSLGEKNISFSFQLVDVDTVFLSFIFGDGWEYSLSFLFWLMDGNTVFLFYFG